MMCSNNQILKTIIIAMLVLSLGFTYLIPSSKAHAQNVDVDDLTVQAGSYKIIVRSDASQISLGTVTYRINITESSDAAPVTDARVIINLQHTTNEGKGWATALHQPSEPGIYLATVQLEAPGIWSSKVDISSKLGRVEIDTPEVSVPEARTTIAGSLVFMGAFLCIILGTIYVIWISKKAVRRRSAGSED